MIQIQYNLTTNPLRIEFPVEWDAKLISALDISIADMDAEVLLAATSATLWADTTLDADVAAYADSIFLAIGATALDIGDPILICGVAGDEVRRVKAYNSTTREVKLDALLDYAHDETEAVYGLFGTYTLDTSTTTTWTLALPVVFTWTPTDTGIPITEMARVSKSALDIQGLRSRFEDKFPRAFHAFTNPVDKFARMAVEAEGEIEQAIEGANLDIQRVVDQSILARAIMAQMAWYWVLQSDDDMTEERMVIANELDKQTARVLNLPIWADDDQDGTEDDGENTSHEHQFERGW